MAQRDRSQGFGFVYVDIAKLLASKQDLPKEGTPMNTGDAQVVNFNKDRKSETTMISDAAPASDTSLQDRAAAVNQIRGNLDRLQSLHHKLHAMLEELNHLTAQKKKS